MILSTSLLWPDKRSAQENEDYKGVEEGSKYSPPNMLSSSMMLAQ